MMATAVVAWGILGLAVSLLALPISLLFSKAKSQRIGRCLHHGIMKRFIAFLKAVGLIRVDLSPLESLNHIDHPVIIAPNHTSLWDAIFLIATIPHALCVMKKSILCNPFLGGGARLAGYISNQSITGMIRASANALRDTDHLVVFPEGTRTRPESRWINPIKGGCALIAIRAGVPVIPVIIRSNTRFLQKGWPIWRPPAFPIRICFEIAPPLVPVAGESAHHFNQRLQAVYETELAKPHPLRRQVASVEN
ncbi:1-acyl-sn-glycerol-3-phosphate acyltransferase [Luteolibacter pohnpeiensis]|uniref:1-acyl-sn-glycerol-3-phosphate acyltransferase n=1 Tax=Luteolibacter pohnpeiensis TaxID=454153 RepID=A0A934S5N2_9BACT|nr:lysophospholipid acyltransferase family protein [Luteolibacter pohnpeiensis]MBK1881715.1 1-acyl-sn-glycerol-3-phosphate acyltransferase [Luteolibacter pohnpeiensis]